jgi:hypothetical protein
MSWKLKLAEQKEIEGAKSGEYPPDWPLIATRVKALAGWRCERCGASHEKDGPNGFVLTVHHLTGEKWLCEEWNLAALCQRCHLRIQARVDFYHDTLDGVHSQWMARHVKGYNVWAWLNDRPLLSLTEVRARDYSKEWKIPLQYDTM